MAIECPRYLGFLWRQHHWHWDDRVEIPIKDCAEGKTERKDKMHCCKCKLDKLVDPYDW